MTFLCPRLLSYITNWFGPLVTTRCRPARQTLLPTVIVWSDSSGWRPGSLRSFLYQLPHKERQRRLSLRSLRKRRLRGGLVVVYKVFFGGLALDPHLFFIPLVRPALKGYPFKFLQGSSRRLRRNSSFPTRVVI